jgi:hypothetical protein
VGEPVAGLWVTGGALVAGLPVAGLPVVGAPVEGLPVTGADVTDLDDLAGAGVVGVAVGFEEPGDFEEPVGLGGPVGLDGPDADAGGVPLPEPGAPVVGEPVTPGAVPDAGALFDAGGRVVLDGEEPAEAPAPLAGGEEDPPDAGGAEDPPDAGGAEDPPDAGGEEAFPPPAGAEPEALPPCPGAVVPPGDGLVDVPLVPPPVPSPVPVSTDSVTYCPNASSVPGAGSEPVTTASSGGTPFPA